jgi:hypothetical protein
VARCNCGRGCDVLDDGYEVALVYSDEPEVQEFADALYAAGKSVPCVLDLGRN